MLWWDRIRHWWADRGGTSLHDAGMEYSGYDAWLDVLNRRHHDEKMNQLHEDSRRWAEEDRQRQDDWHQHHNSWNHHDGSGGAGSRDWPSSSSSWDHHGQ